MNVKNTAPTKETLLIPFAVNCLSNTFNQQPTMGLNVTVKFFQERLK
jgi:hypothetical protein